MEIRRAGSYSFAFLAFLLIPFKLAQAATFVVDTLDDPPPLAAPNGCNSIGPCSLREAVLAANASDEPNTIVLGEGTYQLTIPEAGNPPIDSPETGDLNVKTPSGNFDVTVQGAGEDKTFVSADVGLNERVFNFNGNFITVKISDLTIQNGHSPGNGGGLRVVASNSTTTLTNVSFLDNKSDTSGGGAYIVSGATASTLTNVSFSGNQADGSGGALVHGGSGINLSIDGGTYSDNQSGTEGGAISLFGVGVAPVSLKNITVSNNVAVNGNGGGIQRGGATSFPLQVENVQLLNNSAGNPGGQGFTTGLGGGIYISGNDADVNATVKNSLIQGNTAAGQSGSDGGGGLWVGSSKLFRMDNTTVQNNQALNGKNGGGLFFQNGGLQVFTSTFSGNSAGNGGGIQANVFGAVREVTNSTITGNHADNAGGGLASGGGVAVTLNSVTVAFNSALTGAGLSNTNFGSPISIQNSIFFGNSSNDGSGQTDDCSGAPFSSLGYNVFASAHNTGCTTDGVPAGTAAHDTTADPKLGPLADNGGPTQTHALLAGSSALDAGNPNGCNDQAGNALTTDQRGVARPQGSACDIGAFEVEADLCAGVVCTPTDCQSSSCNPQTGECETAPVLDGTPCDDHNSCTQTDSCVAGACTGSNPILCPASDSCHIGAACVPGGQGQGQSDPCPPNRPEEPKPDGTACNDNNACTTNDACSAGSCVGGAAPNCDDSNDCTTDDCNPVSGCTHDNNSNVCDDGNACTTGDACSGGSCVGGAAPNCDDGNGCTTDGCNPTSGCTHDNNNNACDDSNACTTGDACSGGSCVGGTPLSCGDSNACTVDSCDPVLGCVHDGGCDDSNLCTTDSCGLLGCKHQPVGCPGDHNRCTLPGTCDPSDGQCDYAPKPIDDNNLCTVDSCDPDTGVQHKRINCDDHNRCTVHDRCNPADGQCLSEPKNCDDGKKCTLDSCASSSGNCTHVDLCLPSGKTCRPNAPGADPVTGCK